RIRILTDLIHDGLARAPLYQRGPRLHLRRDDVQVTLAVHPVHVDVVTVVIQHVHRDRDVFRSGELLARLGDAFSGREVDGAEILDLFGGLAADDELRGDILREYGTAERHGSRGDKTRCDDADVHVILL